MHVILEHNSECLFAAYNGLPKVFDRVNLIIIENGKSSRKLGCERKRYNLLKINVAVDGMFSTSRVVDSSIPRGSSLGPFLFLLYT